MVVGVGRLVFRLHDCHSLKAKRSIVKTIIQRLKNRFNISVAETGLNDTLSLAEIGLSMTGNDRRAVNSALDTVFNAADRLGLAEIIEQDMEIVSF